MSQDRITPPARALNGLRVVELGNGVSAPFCARVLADLGADVVKAEPPEGDASRHPQTAATFAYLNAGKKSVRLSGKPEADTTVLSRLARGADVLVTNLRRQEQARHGLSLERLREEAPELVTVEISPYGATGPDRDVPAHEINVCAVGGISVILGEPRQPPLSFPFSVPALQAGLHAAAATLTALHARRTCGLGQAIDVAESDVLAFYAGGMSLFILGGGGKWQRRGFERHGGIYPSGFYPCKDGHIFLATQTRKQWTGFLRLMGDPSWAREDPAFQDGVKIGWKRAEEVDLHFIPWLTDFTRRELTEMAREADLVLGPILEAHELLDEPHLAQRGFWQQARVGETDLRLPTMGYTLSATPARLGSVPQLGEHDGLLDESVEPRRRSTHGPRPSRPLAGYRAIEFGWNWAGPLVGQMLADMGMDVIKVETNERLDFMRHWPHARRFFHNANRGKRSVSINLKEAGGADLVKRLAAGADLVFDNFAAGVMQRNGLGYEHLRAVKSDIVVMSMAMAGQTGPLNHLRGFATTATGFAGLEAAIGYPNSGSTGLPVIGLGDANAAVQGVVACLAALWHREQTGEGQFIDLSQIEAASALMGEAILEAQLHPGAAAGPRGNQHPHMAPHGIYPAAGEDRWISLAIAGDDEWRALVRELEAPAWASDDSLRHTPERLRRREEIDAHLSSWTRQHERDALVQRLRAAGLAVAPVLELDEMNQSTQLDERGLRQDVMSFEGAPAPAYNTPWHLSLTPRAVGGPSPRLGEHNEEIFCGLLGMSPAETAVLTERKVIR